MAERVRADDWTPLVWSHARLMDMQARLDPARMTRYADDWHAVVDQIGDALTELIGQVSVQLSETWRGQGADAALASVQLYVSGSLDGLAVCRSVAVQLAELARAAGELRASVSAPGTEDEALALARQLYSGPAVAAGNAVADIPPPPDPFPIGGPVSGRVLPAGMVSVPATTSTAPPTATTPAAVPLADVGRATAMPHWSDLPRSSLATADTQPLWRAPTSHATVSAPGPDPLPARADPPSAAATPPPPAMPAAVESARASGRGSPSSASVPLLGMGYPGLLGRGDSLQRRAPRYLIAAGNTTELVGELPLVAPPVIGE